MSSPPPIAIESIIHDIIAELYRTNKLEEITVKRVRTAAEQELSLEPGWFKSHAEWRNRSKNFIAEEAVNRHFKTNENEEDTNIASP